MTPESGLGDLLTDIWNTTDNVMQVQGEKVYF